MRELKTTEIRLAMAGEQYFEISQSENLVEYMPLPYVMQTNVVRPIT